ncbi:hypothetical protein EXIGLDRAFT_723631 [Exidia glandulosa HHB12029]|uniref:WDR59/RTC1-like RING zinc finger domain-containing protein n=1 Tax=Exidia glandulosa HHB12029 TaxID=1314781 RepID=A0A165ERR0_EXIGL|nr:hypothetical protein EXIGLDRAFT_723631 [Exidia glandulosa HHB12029]
MLLARKAEGRRRSIGNGAASNASTPSPPPRPHRLFSDTSTGSSATGTFHQYRTYDMSAVVGDDIGSMSISPASRDVVVATRKGLFLIDLDNPVQLPRFLPQGGTWEVAEVQWNPHPSHSQYVVSTSSEKMLLWNLYLTGRTSIEAPLQRAHYRAVTDVNWHTIQPNLVASCALDSWIHVWDIKAPMKPAASLSPFVSSAAQVKWSHFDEHMLASAHYSSVMVWDKRKGSVPLFTIKAHDAKIYGISWSRTRRNEILTCSLDSTVKLWDVSSGSALDVSPGTSPLLSTATCPPLRVAHTRYPVSRARALPFGDGFLTLPQRGETVLELWSHAHGLEEPVHVFEGYGDVVKEFVWRTRGSSTASLSDGTFQLITWGKDRTLRFVPVDSSITEKVGYVPDPTRIVEPPDDFAYESYASMSIMNAPLKPTLSAPVGVNPILNAVRARTELVAPVLLDSRAASKDGRPGVGGGGAMSLGDARSTKGRMRARELNQDEWTKVVAGRSAPNVKDSKSGSGSGQASPSVRSTRANSPISVVNVSTSMRDNERDSGSRGRYRDDSTGANALAEEIVSATEAVAPHKIETALLDPTERRWILGLTGPWGDSASLFLRVSFLFPKHYPVEGIPRVEVEKHPLVSLKSRAYIIRQLDNRRKRKKPVEECLRFLLGLPDERTGLLRAQLRESLIDADADASGGEGSTGTGEEKKVVVRNTQETPVLKISQAVFGPDGILVCIFPVQPQRAPASSQPSTLRLGARNKNPRAFTDAPKTVGLLKALKFLREKAVVPDAYAEGDDREEDVASLRGFGAVSPSKGLGYTTPTSEYVLSTTFSAPNKVRVLLKDFSEQLHQSGALDKTLATNYSLKVGDPVGLCIRNAPIARRYRRYDHERVWKTLQSVLGKTASRSRSEPGQEPRPREVLQWGQNPLARKLLHEMFNEFLDKKDMQLLAMLSIVMLDINRMRKEAAARMSTEVLHVPQPQTGSGQSSSDYFTHRPRNARKATSPAVMQQSPGPSATRGSWSSLSFLPFLGHQSTPQGTPSPPKLSSSAESQPLRRTGSMTSGGATPAILATPSLVMTAGITPLAPRKASSAGGHSRTWSQIVARVPTIKKEIQCAFGPDNDGEQIVQSRTGDSLLEHTFVRQLVAHVRAYGEILDRWGLSTQRVALLKFVPSDHRLPWEHSDSDGLALSATNGVSHCCVCRLPVAGLSHACMRCLHVAHYKCWKPKQGELCASGCGCQCDSRSGSEEASA